MNSLFEFNFTLHLLFDRCTDQFKLIFTDCRREMALRKQKNRKVQFEVADNRSKEVKQLPLEERQSKPRDQPDAGQTTSVAETQKQKHHKLCLLVLKVPKRGMELREVLLLCIMFWWRRRRVRSSKLDIMNLEFLSEVLGTHCSPT